MIIQLTDYGRKILTETRQWVLDNPDRFYWDAFFSQNKSPLQMHELLKLKITDIFGSCGTCLCIGGIVATLDAANRQNDEIELVGYFTITADLAICALIGNDKTDTIESDKLKDFLFYPWNWSDANDCAIDTDKPVDPMIIVREAVARIDWILSNQPLENYVISQPKLIQVGH